LEWKAVQEQTVSSYAPVHETSKADNDYITDELKIVQSFLTVALKMAVPVFMVSQKLHTYH
jgi:hypothetical protein